MLEQYIKTDHDIVRYRHTILGGASIFRVDRVYGTKNSQERLYASLCKDRITQALDGISTTFFFGGPSG
jgi:hypothetical protein